MKSPRYSPASESLRLGDDISGRMAENCQSKSAVIFRKFPTHTQTDDNQRIAAMGCGDHLTVWPKIHSVTIWLRQH
jgi:hypothetical protein